MDELSIITTNTLQKCEGQGTPTSFCNKFIHLPVGLAETKLRSRAISTRTNAVAITLLVSLIPLKT